MKNYKMSFHGVEYILQVELAESWFQVEVEETESCKRWSGKFTQQYIEDITSKSGNFKKFSVFMKMLLMSLEHQSDSVIVDLLTFSDLEMLKSRKQNAQNKMQNVPAKVLKKRYLILTYAVEFDRVHYPLPLTFDETPDPQRMQNTIIRLR